MLMYAATSFLGVTTEVLLTPYVLATNSRADVLGWVVAATSAGLLLGGLLLSMWGGPKRRVVGILGFELIVSICTLIVGLRLPVVGIALESCLFISLPLR